MDWAFSGSSGSSVEASQSQPLKHVHGKLQNEIVVMRDQSTFHVELSQSVIILLFIFSTLDLLFEVKGLYIAESLNTRKRPLMSNTRLLVSTEWVLWAQLQMRVNPNATGLDLATNSATLLHISSPDRSTESHLRVVGTGQNLLLSLPGQDWENWTEWLLGDNAGVVLWTVDDGWLDEVAWGVGWVLAADCDLPAFLLDVLEEAANALVPGLLLAIVLSAGIKLGTYCIEF